MLQRQLQWLGHVTHMPSNRLPRRLLYGELLLGQRPVGRPKLHYSDHMKPVLRQCNIPVSDLEQLAEDRELQRLTCTLGLKNLTAASEQAASDHCARRHAATAATPVCPHCGRTCALDFSLHSHRCINLWLHYNYISTTSSSKSTDYLKQASKQQTSAKCWLLPRFIDLSGPQQSKVQPHKQM